MRIDQIKPYIISSYSVTVRWGSLEATLKGYEKDYGLDINPDFQRGHVWTPQQQTGYIEHILRNGQNAREVYLNCPGWDNRGMEIYGMTVVDGLQRITAVRKFINNEIPAFGVYLSDFEDGDLEENRHQVGRNGSFLFNIAGLNKRSEVLQWYLDLNRGGTPHSQEELTRIQGLLAEAILKGE